MDVFFIFFIVMMAASVIFGAHFVIYAMSKGKKIMYFDTDNSYRILNVREEDGKLFAHGKVFIISDNTPPVKSAGSFLSRPFLLYFGRHDFPNTIPNPNDVDQNKKLKDLGIIYNPDVIDKLLSQHSIKDLASASIGSGVKDNLFIIIVVALLGLAVGYIAHGVLSPCQICDLKPAIEAAAQNARVVGGLLI